MIEWIPDNPANPYCNVRAYRDGIELGMVNTANRGKTYAFFQRKELTGNWNTTHQYNPTSIGTFDNAESCKKAAEYWLKRIKE